MYQPIRSSQSLFFSIRDLNYHVRHWAPETNLAVKGTSADPAPILVMLHGWMDVSASFQFLVDSLKQPWQIFSPDWRGYGRSSWGKSDTYWFADYIADLDALLDHISPNAPVNLVAHSMGGNVACLYAGARPERVARLVNLEGYGMPATKPSQAPKRYAKWLDELKEGSQLRAYESQNKVAERLQKTNPRLRLDFAQWLATEWSGLASDNPHSVNQPQEFELLADPAHKLSTPILYQVDEVLACWRAITAPVLFVESDEANEWHEFTRGAPYRERLNAFSRLELATITQAGHMLHHDQPEKLAALIEPFLSRPL
jgi:pimeloyl-ACP methyl ester carboxylesterase